MRLHHHDSARARDLSLLPALLRLLLERRDVALHRLALRLKALHFALEPLTAKVQGAEPATVRGRCEARAVRMARAAGRADAREGCARAHMSLLMNSTRLVTLFFTSMSSCFTSTGPISLNTLESSSSSSSSCGRGRSGTSASARSSGRSRQHQTTTARERAVNEAAVGGSAAEGGPRGPVHLEHQLILENLRLRGRNISLHLANLLLDGAICVELSLERVAAIAHLRPLFAPVSAGIQDQREVMPNATRRRALRPHAQGRAGISRIACAIAPEKMCRGADLRGKLAKKALEGRTRVFTARCFHSTTILWRGFFVHSKRPYIAVRLFIHGVR